MLPRFCSRSSCFFRWTPALSRDGALALAAVTILFPPVLDHLVFGQNKMLVLLMFVLMLRWMERGRDGAAGLMLAFATLLRAFPLLLVGYLISDETMARGRLHHRGTRRRRRAHDRVGGHRNDAELCACADLSDRAMGQALPGNIAIGPTVARMFWYFFGIHLGTALQWAAKAASLAAELALLAFTIKVTVSRPRDDDPDGRLFILWIMTAILISPTSWFYYLVLLTIPMVKLSAAAANNRTSARALWTGVACYTLAWIYFTRSTCTRKRWRCIRMRWCGGLELRRWRCSPISRSTGSRPISVQAISRRRGCRPRNRLFLRRPPQMWSRRCVPRSDNRVP